MPEIDRHDLEACGDVFDWLTENADALSADKAIEMLEAARRAETKLKAAISMLQSQAMQTMERRPIVVDNVVYSKRPAMKQRPELPKIITAVVEWASAPNRATGEVPTAFEAATSAADAMINLYVSPSTVPKITGLKVLGLRLGDVTHKEHTGYELKRTVLEEENDD